MVTINWFEIIHINKSQNNAFEELVCQLAKNEEIEGALEFKRLGTPDGGVEAYWVLENGDEYGWQAKNFHKLEKTQWDQIKKSFQTALEKHPKLTKYYICIPIDRPDPRIPGKESLMDKWNTFVKNMQKIARNAGRKIEFEYWGNFELTYRLTKPCNVGKIKYFFGKNEFSFEWLVDKCNESIIALDKRYTPELNFELEIAKMFNCLAFDEIFKKELRNSINSLLQAANKCLSSFKDLIFRDDCSLIKESIDKIIVIFNHIRSSSIVVEELNVLTQTIKKLFEIINQIDDSLCLLEQNESGDYKIARGQYDYQKTLIRRFKNNYYLFTSRFNQVTLSLISKKVLFLNGEAGSGKSHLLADITKKRIDNNKPTLFFLGEFFTSEENPWTQIFRNIIRLENISESDFLGSLDSLAESYSSRLLIIIDAINEGKGIYFWNTYLMNFIDKISKYDHLALVISYRTSYQESLIPKSFLKEYGNNFITHKGFELKVDEAIKMFFDYYDIEYPSVPLLNPEFSNPLFLKLFCEGLNNKGRKKSPEGYSGISEILKFYIKEKNVKVSNIKYLDFDPSINLVQKAIDLFIDELLNKDTLYLMYDEAQSLFAEKLGHISNSNKILQHLISEGIFSKNIYHESTVGDVDIVRLTYQRFEDHLITSNIINGYLGKVDPKEWFTTEGYLHKLIIDENSLLTNSGLIEALSIQIPEKVELELYELIPQFIEHPTIVSAFLDSLIWRKPESINERTIKYINHIQNLHWSYLEKFIDILFFVGSNPKHHYNADTLHNYLISYKLPDRDAWWIEISQENFIQKGSIYRLIDWNLKTDYFQQLNRESKLLTCKLLIWLLASSNRRLRDTATKALIKSINSDFLLLVDVLESFSNIDDPYILERLYCVGYGCALRTEKSHGLENLCNYIYSDIFDQDEVYPNILLRDYARGIIERGKYLGLKFKFNVNKTQPPYNSKLPNALPTNDEINSHFMIDYEKIDEDYLHSQNEILRSMSTGLGRGTAMYGDFGRYIFHYDLLEWNDVDTNFLSNWAIKHIFELGYDAKKHGTFDRMQSHNRDEHEQERIGKKYQWIAYYEILARISDNKKFKREIDHHKGNKWVYEGPWDPYIRNIDPSILLTHTKGERFTAKTNNWWCDASKINWEGTLQEWISSKTNILDPQSLIMLKDNFNQRWFNLKLSTHWFEEEYVDVNGKKIPQKGILYYFSSFLTSNKNLDLMKDLTSLPNQFNSFSFETRNQYEIFEREYYWSKAYNHFSTHYYSGDFERDFTLRGKKIKIIIPVENYILENEYDYSKTDTISFYVPSASLFSKMGMKFSDIDSQFVNQKGELLCYDPSVYDKSPQCFIIKGNEFVNFLKEEGLSIIWIFWYKKDIYSDDSDDIRSFKRLEANGLYYLQDGEIQGSYTII